MITDEMIKDSSDFRMSETTFDPKVPLDKVVSSLRLKRVTGKLVFDLSQGGIQKISLVVKNKT